MAKKAKTIAAKELAREWEQRLAKIAEEQAHKRESKLTELKLISAELYAKGITKFLCEYNGEGDSGDISYTYYEKNDAFGQKASDDISEADVTKLQNIVWEFVPAGFENNDGGFGTVIIDFQNNQIEIEHSDRIVEVETHEKKYNFNGDEL